jgi:ribonuclease HI
VDKLTKLGKEFSLVGSTLLQTFALACKKEAAQRSEFESLMFTQYQAGIDKGIAGFAKNVAEAEPVKAQKDAAVTNAQAALAAAEAALVAAAEAEKAAAAAHKESVKAVSQGNARLYSIWSDMKVVCDKQDAAQKTLTHHVSDIMSAFKELKEKEPEPEPVEEPAPVEEAAASAEAPAVSEAAAA